MALVGLDGVGLASVHFAEVLFEEAFCLVIADLHTHVRLPYVFLFFEDRHAIGNLDSRSLYVDGSCVFIFRIS